MFLNKYFTQVMRENRRWRSRSLFLAGLLLVVLVFGVWGQVGVGEGMQESAGPKVVSVFPADGATVAGGEVEVRIKFDRPMNPSCTELNITRDSLFNLKELNYNEGEFEFVFLMELESGFDYSFWVNKYGDIISNRGFRDRQNIPAEVYEWSFRTESIEVREGETAPKALLVSMPQGDIWPLLSMIRIKFDQPMESIFRLLVEHSPGVEFRNCKIFKNQIVYDPVNYEFTVPLMLPPKWSGPVALSGFTGSNGLQAEPVSLVDVVTSSEIYAVEFIEQMQKAGQADELKQLLEKMKQARRQITSLSESVHSIWTYSYAIRSTEATFKIQGERQFFGDVSRVMSGTYIVGSDGEKCWYYSGEKLVVAAYDEIKEKNLIFSDPFLLMEREPAEAIEALRLEYLGLEERDGKLYHVVRSWWVEVNGSRVSGEVDVWWIDSEHYLVDRIEKDSGNIRTVCDFSYDRINEEIGIAEFQPGFAAQIEPQRPRPLEEGFDRWFLTIADGSNSEMSERWGQIGPGGKASSGLNHFSKR